MLFTSNPCSPVRRVAKGPGGEDHPIVTDRTQEGRHVILPCEGYEVSKVDSLKPRKYTHLVWVSRLEGHLRTQGYEDADGDSLRPPKKIHLRKLTGSSGPSKRHLTGNSGPFKASEPKDPRAMALAKRLLDLAPELREQLGHVGVV